MATRTPKDAQGDRWLQSRNCLIPAKRQTGRQADKEMEVGTARPSQAMETNRWNLRLSGVCNTTRRFMGRIWQIGRRCWNVGLGSTREAATHLTAMVRQIGRRSRNVRMGSTREAATRVTVRRQQTETEMPSENATETPQETTKPKRRLRSLKIFQEEEEARQSEQRLRRQKALRMPQPPPSWVKPKKEKITPKRWNLGLGFRSREAKWLMEEFRQAELEKEQRLLEERRLALRRLQERRVEELILQCIRSRNAAQQRNILSAAHEDLQAWPRLFALYDPREEEELILAQEEQQHRQDQRRQRRREQVSEDVPVQKIQPLQPNPFEPQKEERKEEPQAVWRMEGKLCKRCEPWPLEERKRKHLVERRKQQQHQRVSFVSGKRGGLRLCLCQAPGNWKSEGVRTSCKRALEEEEESPPTRGLKAKHPEAMKPPTP